MNLPACCMDFDIRLEHLLFPERMDANGWEFISAHGLGGMTLTELQSRSIDMAPHGKPGEVKVRHRCAQLLDDGTCGIYLTRPAICRAFDCSQRTDCACNGAGFIAMGDLEFERA